MLQKIGQIGVGNLQLFIRSCMLWFLQRNLIIRFHLNFVQNLGKGRNVISKKTDSHCTLVADSVRVAFTYQKNSTNVGDMYLNYLYPAKWSLLTNCTQSRFIWRKHAQHCWRVNRALINACCIILLHYLPFAIASYNPSNIFDWPKHVTWLNIPWVISEW